MIESFAAERPALTGGAFLLAASGQLLTNKALRGRNLMNSDLGVVHHQVKRRGYMVNKFLLRARVTVDSTLNCIVRLCWSVVGTGEQPCGQQLVGSWRKCGKV